ncbi:flagellar protein FlgJ [Desulfosarcina sp. BuS5]|uniref:rod-binding protein n=1 Tax=Desulfosarcina sp. BuS5 TaxID=933262 RepID=UPI000687065B|nr:rod-binding protein [Desulfosarcina sp. BuS5]WDN90016.1 flagellar protein FlgJ [Desulfosarcina sp. BuS5]
MPDFSVQRIPFQAINMKNRLCRAEEAIKKEKKAGGNSDAALNRTCVEMESLFICQLFKEMRATIPKSGFISGGRAEEVYRSMLDSELAKELAKRNGLGLAPMLRSQLQKEIIKKP